MCFDSEYTKIPALLNRGMNRDVPDAKLPPSEELSRTATRFAVSKAMP